jgi:hypothetical protein
MAQKYDGVIEVVRYSPAGKIELVRAYERRGPTFSDRVLWNRSELVERLKSGRKIVTGSRKLLLASTFEVGKTVRLLRGSRGDVVTTAAGPGEGDQLDGVPLF